MVEDTPNGPLTHRLTREQVYRMGKIYENNRRIMKWDKVVKYLQTYMSHYSSKTSDLNKFTEFVSRYMSDYNGTNVYRAMWDHYSQRRCSMLRMDNYIHKRKTLDNFFMSLTPVGAQKPVIAYGAAKFASGGKGEISVPVNMSMTGANNFIQWPW